MNRSPWSFLALFFLCCCHPSDKQSFQGEPFGVLSLDSTNLSIEIIASNLEVPWDLLIDCDNNLWFTQQRGTISKLDLKSGQVSELMELPDVHFQKSRGLLSMALHPDFKLSPIVYCHYNYLSISETDTLIKSRLVSYSYDEKSDDLQYRSTLLDSIPGQTYHNGSRMIISHDQKILLTTGDAGAKNNSQNMMSFSGKVLRINLDGTLPDDNPFAGSYTYALGLRNAQGLVMGDKNQIYISDHGPNNDDEINLLFARANYGWPLVEGYRNHPAEIDASKDLTIVEPMYTWTPTVAPAGIAYYDHESIPEWRNSLLVATLKAQFLGVLNLNLAGNEISSSHVYLQSIFGRIRDVVVSDSGDIYLSTSNHDWHPKSQPWMYDSFPTPADDRIFRLSAIDKRDQIKISSQVFQEVELARQFPSANTQTFDISGKSIYQMNCSNCHMEDGKGIPNLIPPISNTDWVTGDNKRLILSVLEGLSEEIIVNGKKYHQEMPGFKTQLSDHEIASVLTFIRSNFENSAAEIQPNEVAKLRK